MVGEGETKERRDDIKLMKEYEINIKTIKLVEVRVVEEEEEGGREGAALDDPPRLMYPIRSLRLIKLPVKKLFLGPLSHSALLLFYSLLFFHFFFLPSLSLSILKKKRLEKGK